MFPVARGHCSHFTVNRLSSECFSLKKVKKKHPRAADHAESLKVRSDSLTEGGNYIIHFSIHMFGGCQMKSS